MDADRLAAYLAGELETDERAAVEAALARDPAARARLERMRAADAALDRLAPATPRAGFLERLHGALDEEVRTSLRREPPAGHEAPADGHEAPAGGHDDELAVRRARRRSWPTALGGAAAGLALLAVVGLAVGGPLGSGSGEDAGTETAMDAGGEDAGGDEAATTESDAAGSLEAAPPEGPVVRATGEITEEALETRFDRAPLPRLRERGLSRDEGRRLADAYTARLASGPSPGSTSESVPREESGGAGAQEQAEDGDAAGDGGRAAPASEDLAAARRCLDTLLTEEPGAVPAYVELTTFDGDPAILYGLVAPGADGRTYDRVELWLVGRADCQVRSFHQRDG